MGDVLMPQVLVLALTLMGYGYGFSAASTIHRIRKVRRFKPHDSILRKVIQVQLAHLGILLLIAYIASCSK